MSEFGLKIKNIKAGTLFGYNQGVRNRYDYTEAMFSNSLFSDYIIQNGLNVWNDTSTRDIICLDFDFGSRSYEEEITYASYTLFPTIGKTNAIYVDTTTNAIYRWDDNNIKYYALAFDPEKEFIMQCGSSKG